jgi:hypothetical protein
MEMNTKRIVLRAVITAALAMPPLWVAPPLTYAEATQIRTPVSFIMTPARCPDLQLTVEGSGESFVVINSRVDNDGVNHIQRNDLITGTASDSEGAIYVFNYHNHSTMEVPAGGFPFQITTTDHFVLNGRGKANQLQVGFVAHLTFTGPSDPPIIEVVNLRGNPMACDGF